jgi:hypothetical protein
MLCNFESKAIFGINKWASGAHEAPPDNSSKASEWARQPVSQHPPGTFTIIALSYIFERRVILLNTYRCNVGAARSPHHRFSKQLLWYHASERVCGERAVQQRRKMERRLVRDCVFLASTLSQKPLPASEIFIFLSSVFRHKFGCESRRFLCPPFVHARIRFNNSPAICFKANFTP